MARQISAAERRVSRVLLLAAAAGVLWHTVDGLRPPPPPLELIRGALRPDSTGAPPLYESTGGNVYTGVDGGRQEPIDLLTADAEMLQKLPGIGPVLARRIVEWRARQEGAWSIEDLQEVSGIGPSKLAGFRGLARVGRAVGDTSGTGTGGVV